MIPTTLGLWMLVVATSIAICLPSAELTGVHEMEYPTVFLPKNFVTSSITRNGDTIGSTNHTNSLFGKDDKTLKTPTYSYNLDDFSNSTTQRIKREITSATQKINAVESSTVLNATSVVEAIVESGMALSDVVNNFNKAEITPIIDDLNERIRNLNLEKAGIPAEKIPEYKQTLRDFSNIRKELLTMRIILKSLARETINRANSLLSLIDIAEKKPDKAKKALKVAANVMVKLIIRSKDILDEAEAYLKDVNKQLTDIDVNLLELSKKLESNYEKIMIQLNETEAAMGLDDEDVALIMLNEKGKVRKKRFICGGLCIGAIALGVVGAAGGIAGLVIKSKNDLNKMYKANEELANNMKKLQDQMAQMHTNYESAMNESKQRIKQLEKELKAAQARNLKMLRERRELNKKQLENQKALITTASNSVHFFIGKLKESEKHVATELILVTDWKARLIELIDIMDGLDLIDFIELDKDGAVVMINNLKGACQNYIDYRIPKDYEGIV